MFLAQRKHFLQDVFQMTYIALVSVINPNYINGFHLFWDNLYNHMVSSNYFYLLFVICLHTDGFN